MTGLGLVQVALFAGAAAVVFAIIGVVAAGSQDDPTASRAADTLGAGLAALLSAPEPEWWTHDHDTWQKMYVAVRDAYSQQAKDDWPKLDKGKLAQIQTADHKQTQRNKNRFAAMERALTPGLQGALRGLMIRASDSKRLGDHSLGARINPVDLKSSRKLGLDIYVGSAVAAPPGGSPFNARVYYRQYKDTKGERVGDVYVILSEAALQSAGGGGVWLLLTPLLVAGAVAVFLVTASKTAQGMRNLARDLDTIGRGRLDLRIYTSGAGELGYLQKTADRMAKNLQLIQSTGSGDLDEALEKELDLANQIHQGLLPSDPPRVPGYELETLFKVGRDIGGDYHDYIELDENHIVVVLADCSENLRGVPAAMVMAMTRAYLKASIDPGSSPGAWLKTVNRRLARDLKSGMAVTAVVVCVNPSTHEAVAASAGHRPIVMWRQGKTATINPNGIALGLDVGPVFEKTMEEKKFSFQKNDRIVLYTDGVLSAENAEGEAYGEQRLLESIRRQGAMNSAAFVNFVAGGVDKFLDETEQPDDITICTLKRMK